MVELIKKLFYKKMVEVGRTLWVLIKSLNLIRFLLIYTFRPNLYENLDIFNFYLGNEYLWLIQTKNGRVIIWLKLYSRKVRFILGFGKFSWWLLWLFLCRRLSKQWTRTSKCSNRIIKSWSRKIGRIW